MTETRQKINILPDPIEAAISFIYVNIDFFAAPYLGAYHADIEKQHRSPVKQTHIGEAFQKWANGLKKQDAIAIRMISTALKDAIGNDEITWQRVLTGIPLFEEKDISLFFGKDKQKLLRNLLEENPKLLAAIQKISHHHINKLSRLTQTEQYTIPKSLSNPLIEKWYCEEAPNEAKLRNKERTKIEEWYLKLHALSHQANIQREASQFNDNISHKIIKNTFINLEYFAQISDATKPFTDELQELILFFKKNETLNDDKKHSTRLEFIDAVIGKDNNNSIHSLLNNNGEKIENLLATDGPLRQCLYLYCFSNYQDSINTWYKNTNPLDIEKRSIRQAFLRQKEDENNESDLECEEVKPPQIFITPPKRIETGKLSELKSHHEKLYSLKLFKNQQPEIKESIEEKKTEKFETIILKLHPSSSQ